MSRQTILITGIALIVLPLVALGLKLFSFGWLMVMLMFGPVFVMIIGYVLQIVIATQGFLVRRDLFGSALRRATLASWISLIGIVLLGIFVPDGGDSGYGSTFQVWLGAYGENGDAVHASTDALGDVVTFIAMAAWIVGFVWLVAEWIAALVRRNRARKAGVTAG
ncbi:MAG: hypothetical protein GX814_06340 [Microbacteriaceae bacterium]|nr:hypothetical protein [Microbacteriaceae bacterium]